jgi:hypothetical protein
MASISPWTFNFRRARVANMSGVASRLPCDGRLLIGPVIDNHTHVRLAHAQRLNLERLDEIEPWPLLSPHAGTERQDAGLCASLPCSASGLLASRSHMELFVDQGVLGCLLCSRLRGVVLPRLMKVIKLRRHTIRHHGCVSRKTTTPCEDGDLSHEDSVCDDSA